MPAISAAAILEVAGLSKSFGSVQALRDVDWSLPAGEIHAVLGENGAGKSTLIRILAGDHEPDAGRIGLDGQEVRFSHPHEALRHGIACVHQVPAFVADLSVTENLRLGRGYGRGRAGLIDWDGEHHRAAQALRELGLTLDPRTPVGALGAHGRQLVALCRALSTDPRILILDEITAPLSEPEVELLHDVVRGLRARDVTVVYISHRLEEVIAVADRVTVLRDGRHVTTEPMAGLTHARLAELIVGRPVGELFARREHASAALAGAAPVLTVEGVGERARGVSFSVAPGEIVGLAGLAGSGRSRVLSYLFGARRSPLGEMRLNGRPYRPKHPSDAIAAGVALVTEDRLADGFVERLSVGHNITLPWLDRFQRRGLLALRAERRAAQDVAERLGVKMPSLGVAMSALSGGNQQKAILARWTATEPGVLLLDEPTHGVDVGSKAEIYELIRRHAAGGMAVVMVSSELEELEALCDHVALLRDGEMIGTLEGDDVTRDAMLHELLVDDREAPVA